MRRGVPAPLPPDQIKPLTGVGIEEGRGSARKPPPPPPPAPSGWSLDEFGSPRPTSTARLPDELGQRKASEKRNPTPDVKIRRMIAVGPFRYRIGGPEGAFTYAATLWGARRKSRRMQRRTDAARRFNT